MCASMCRTDKNVCDSEKYYLILHIWKIIKVNVFTIQYKQKKLDNFLSYGDIQERSMYKFRM